MINPLLDIKDLPPFSKIKEEHVVPALTQKLQSHRELLQQLLNDNQGNYTWDNLIHPLEKSDNELDRLWSPISHLNAVMNSPELRDAYNQCLPMLSDFQTEIGQNRTLYKAIKSIQEKSTNLNASQQKSLQDTLKGFKLSGIDLPTEQRERYKQISQELSKLTSLYSDNVLDATNKWHKQITNKNDLQGMPESAIAAAKQEAENRGIEGWVITLDYPSYHAVITYADSKTLRKDLYHAYATRASDESDIKGLDNKETMRKILQLRQEKAELLNFSHYAELSNYSKMASNVDTVISFLEDLAKKSKPFAEKEINKLRTFAKSELNIENLEAWDLSYASEKLKQKQFDISEEELKPYFPVDQVLNGLFDLVERLYNIKVQSVKNEVDVWHDDVRFYEILNQDGQTQAKFYLDLYARKNKRGGAWMDSFCSRFDTDEEIQLPVAYMTCNSAPPVGDKPALFTHNDVITLFHEFGHGLHHMLTQVSYLDISGISGVEWDAVELPSQFMENWCWEREALDLFASHYKTGEKIPDTLYQKMKASKDFHAGFMMMRQLEFALFDIEIHRDPNISNEENGIADKLYEVRKNVSVLIPPKWNRFENSFSHIFSGGYAAGYYSYKWAEVLSADAYSQFEEEGLFNPKVGKRFQKEILEAGGSRPAMESFIAFRGREPSIEALLRHNGLMKEEAA